MDRIISNHNKQPFFKEFELIDLFPYAIALLMICGEIYILHQFVVLTPVHY